VIAMLGVVWGSFASQFPWPEIQANCVIILLLFIDFKLLCS